MYHPSTGPWTTPSALRPALSLSVKAHSRNLPLRVGDASSRTPGRPYSAPYSRTQFVYLLITQFTSTTKWCWERERERSTMFAAGTGSMRTDTCHYRVTYHTPFSPDQYEQLSHMTQQTGISTFSTFPCAKSLYNVGMWRSRIRSSTSASSSQVNKCLTCIYEHEWRLSGRSTVSSPQVQRARIPSGLVMCLYIH